MSDDNSKVIDLLSRAADAGAVAITEQAAETIPPPNGATPTAQAFWYAVLERYDLTLSEMAILEEVIHCRTAIEALRADWEADGSPMTAKGSMGQPVIDPRLAETRSLRAQHATLLKSLALPTEVTEASPTIRRRPGRPSRAESHATGKWGTRG